MERKSEVGTKNKEFRKHSKVENMDTLDKGEEQKERERSDTEHG